jgi:hypothetical protein
MPCEKDRFFSLGDNGKLLQWTMETRVGWTALEEKGIEYMLDADLSSCDSERAPQFIAAHSSKLAPHVVMLANNHKKIVCLDTRNLGASCHGSLPRGCSFQGGA